jgi:hypothetical protein
MAAPVEMVTEALTGLSETLYATSVTADAGSRVGCVLNRTREYRAGPV